MIRTLTANGTTWQTAPELLDHGVLGPDGLRLADWLASSRATVVKKSPHCDVYRVVLPGLDFYLKHYHPSDARSRARALLRTSKARAEADRIRQVAARDVPTLEVLACGDGPEGSFLLTRTVPGARTLTEFLETELPSFDSARKTRVRQRLATALGRLLARMHEAGVVHADLHPGNLLLRLGPNDEPELYLIDLYAVRLGPALDWPRGRENLIVLNRWFMLRSARSDRMRCWKAYREARAFPFRSRRTDVDGRNAARDLEHRTLVSNLQFWRGKDRRCLGGNRWFRRVRSEVAVGHAASDLDPAVLAPLLADPDEPFRHPGIIILKDSRSSTVIEFDLPVGGLPRRVIYKRFAVTRWTDPWAALFRPPPALRSYVMGHGLRCAACRRPGRWPYGTARVSAFSAKATC